MNDNILSALRPLPIPYEEVGKPAVRAPKIDRENAALMLACFAGVMLRTPGAINETFRQGLEDRVNKVRACHGIAELVFVHETAARIRAAAEPGFSKAGFDEIEVELARQMAEPTPAKIAPTATFLTAQRLADTRDLASWHEQEGRTGTATMIFTLVEEIEKLREAAKGSLVIVNQAVADKNIAVLRACTLLNVAQKIAPVLDEEIENRKAGCNPEDWASLQVLSDELHATIKLVRG